MIGRCDPITKKKRVKKKGKKRDSQLVKLRFAAFVLFLSTFFEQLQYSVVFVEMQEKMFGSLYKNTIKYFSTDSTSYDISLTFQRYILTKNFSFFNGLKKKKKNIKKTRYFQNRGILDCAGSLFRRK